MDASDWMLIRSMFLKIQSLWLVEIDLFANAWNAHLTTFVSWFRQPLALTTNAFSLCWRSRSSYAFPPFSLIPKCLAKIHKEKATLVLVCPLWPTQPWFPLLLELAAGIPRILRTQSDKLMPSIQQPHPLIESLILTAWKLSGNASKIRCFQRRLLASCLKPTVPAHNLVSNQHGIVGLIGVLSGIPIPCLII